MPSCPLCKKETNPDDEHCHYCGTSLNPLEFSKQLARGRKLVILIIVISLGASLLLSLVNLTIAVMTLGINAVLSRGVEINIALEVVLAFFLYKGHQWAKWGLGVLLIIGAVYSGARVYAMLNYPIVVVILIIVSFLFLISTIILLTSPFIRVFLHYQRQEGEV